MLRIFKYLIHLRFLGFRITDDFAVKNATKLKREIKEDP